MLRVFKKPNGKAFFKNLKSPINSNNPVPKKKIILENEKKMPAQ